MIELYWLSVATVAGIGLLMLVLSTASLADAKSRTGWYAREEWVPKSKQDVKVSLLLLAAAPLGPLVFLAAISFVMYWVVIGIVSAFKED